MSVEILGPPHRSYSSFTTYLSCGKQWQLDRVIQAPEVPAWYLVGGSAVHTATEGYDKARLGVSAESATEFLDTEVPDG